MMSDTIRRERIGTPSSIRAAFRGGQGTRHNVNLQPGFVVGLLPRSKMGRLSAGLRLHQERIISFRVQGERERFAWRLIDLRL